MFHMTQPVQTRENHAKYDPAFHFLLAPLSFILFIWSLVNLYHAKTSQSALMAAGFFTLLALVFKTRIYSLKVQDRLIRLEERLRLGALCGEALRTRISQLTERQLIALRFAGDAEVAALAARALDENLQPKQIKAAIQNWRGDYFRI
jgi:hypothetical protein